MTSGSAGYFMDGDTSYVYTSTSVPTEELVATVQEYLDRLGNADLSLVRLREFRWAYQGDVVERSTGRYAFGLMIGKGTSQISPKAGPNLFWNTKYGSMIAEVGGGYGMVGRMLTQEPAGDMAITQAQARSIAEKAVAEIGSNLKLHDEVDTYYGFYEYPPEAFEPGANVEVRIWQQGKPEPKVKVMDSELLARIWEDFEPYFEALQEEVAEELPGTE